MVRLKTLKKLIKNNKLDYFLSLEGQIPTKYFFSNKGNILFNGKEIKTNIKIDELKNKKIGMYLNDLPYKKVKALKKKINIKDLSHSIDNIRLIKDKSEIQKMKKACQVTKRLLESFEISHFKNKSEIEVHKEIIRYYLNNDVDPAFNPIVAYNHHAYTPHHMPTTYKPKKLEVVLIDTGAKYKEYNSDITRVFVSKKYKKYKEDLNHLLHVLEDVLYDGANIQEITNIAKSYLKEYGKASFEHHHLLGHGIGLEVHENPDFRKNTTLKNNMTIALEPGIYFKNRFGLRIENIYVIKKKKAKNLCY